MMSMQTIGKIKPILFNTQDIRAILDGRKTVTRRVIKPRCKDNECGWQIITNAHTHEFLYAEYYDECEEGTRIMEPPYQPGDTMYIKESFQYRGACNITESDARNDEYIYKVGFHPTDELKEPLGWCSPVCMPKEAARIWLKVTDVRAERLQDITISGLQSEGFLGHGYISQYAALSENIFDRFKVLWDSTIKKVDLDKYGWEANPFVWVIAFERCEKPEPCILRGIDPAESKRPCIGYAVSDINDEPCEMCKRCKQCTGNCDSEYCSDWTEYDDHCEEWERRT